MKIALDNQKEKWNQFVMENNGSFLQSWQWGEFQELLGRKIWRIEMAGLRGLVIKHNLPLGKSYLYCPRGPVGQISPNGFERFLEENKKIAHSEKSIFFKIEPSRSDLFDTETRSDLFDTTFFCKNYKKRLYQKGLTSIQPDKTLILDITKSEEELLSQLHQKTRYNIRLAQKKGVTVEESNEKIDDFLRLLKQTAKRDKFHPHPQVYYQKMLDVLGKEGMIKLFLAKYQSQIIAANIVCFFGSTATYLHGASDYDSRHLMAPYLCQWQAICQAKKLDFRFYDFWGIDEKKWPGPTRFKKGFGGQEVDYPGAFDLVFQPIWYQVYNLARRVL